MIKFWELAPSPNNTKVRMALRFKNLPFEVAPVDPIDRGALIQSSGQELSPVIEDKGIVLNDSEAILQYLDANYRESPRLFPADRAGRKACDAWKSTLDRRIVPSWAPVFFTAIGRQDGFEAAAVQGFHDAMQWLEDELDGRDSFGGTEMPIQDLRVAEWATYALPGRGLMARVPLFARFKELFGVEEGTLPRLERFLATWNERLA